MKLYSPSSRPKKKRILIRRCSSTKAERRFLEILKRNHIPFIFRSKIAGREIDFLIGKIAIEIGDHSQDIVKNKQVIESGYSLLFISNKDLRDNPIEVEKHLLTYWLHGKSTTFNTH